MYVKLQLGSSSLAHPSTWPMPSAASSDASPAGSLTLAGGASHATQLAWTLRDGPRGYLIIIYIALVPGQLPEAIPPSTATIISPSFL